jgi:uncharacterized protein YutE (UPF0331/DUF86 family)
MRLSDKIKEIEEFLSELDEITPASFAEYEQDIKAKAACERYFEKIVEAIVDLVFIIIKEKRYKMPEADKEAFDILAKEQIITKEIAEKLKDAKGMRNIIVHEYGKINDEFVFNSVKEELQEDTYQFLKQVKLFLKR